jgi:hypothetical protein
VVDFIAARGQQARGCELNYLARRAFRKRDPRRARRFTGHPDYTLLLPLVAFAALGSSRYLVVASDSATAAVLAGGLAGLATPGSAY